MKYSTYCYKLKFANSTRSPRKGFLIRAESREGVAGYSDCFSWPELGDRAHDVLLEAFRRGDRDLGLLKASVSKAHKDARARAKKISLLNHHEKIKNHFLVVDFEALTTEDLERISSLGFSSMKIKVRPGDEKRLRHICTGISSLGLELQLRLDFNGQWEDSFLPVLLDSRPYIDFIEDPFLSVDPRWVALGEQLQIDLARDFASHGPGLDGDLIVVKPARRSHIELDVANPRRIFTSYLGHPVGQAHDMATYLESRGEDGLVGQPDQGFRSHTVYEPNPFSRGITSTGPFVCIPGTYGIGFGETLEGLSWQGI